MLSLTSTAPRAKNCLGCARYLDCKDKLKSVIYICSSYKETKQSKVAGIERLFDFADLDSGLYLPQSHDELDGPAILDPTAGKDQSFDIEAVINDMVKSDTMVSSDIKINDRDFAQAPNFYTFCVSDKFLNQKPYLEQAIIGTRVMAEYCPDCSDMEWFEHTHKVKDSLGKFEKKVALLEKGVCPHCKKGRAWFVRKRKLNPYYEAAVSAGQRSGKSAWLGMMSAYLTHLQIKLQKPNEVYGLMNSNVLHGTFAALTYAQAKDTLWEPYYGHLTDSPWFQGYHKMLDHAQDRYGEELYKLKDTFVMYRHRRLLVYPAGPDKRTLRGRTRFFASIDELGWFDNSADSGKVKMNANEVYIALERSLLTVRAAAADLMKAGFDNVPPGYFLNISSPSSVRDKIMELVRTSQGSRKIYGIIKPTWEMNPKVPRSALEEEFRKDPVAAMRDYGAQPPLSANPLISAHSYVESIFAEKKNPIKVTHFQKKTLDGHATRYAKIDKIKGSGKASCMAMDAGYSNNSFACAIGHLKDKKWPVISLLVEVMPLPGVPLNYRKIYDEIMLPIIAQRNVKLLAADRWNSLKILSDAEEDAEILTRQYSLKYPDMQVFKSYILDGQLTIPKPEWSMETILGYDQSKYPEVFKNQPAEHFALQLLTVQDTGSSVIKGDQLTDDLVRAAMLCTNMLLSEEYEDLFTQADAALENRIDISQAAVFRGGSGGGGGRGGQMSADAVSPGAMGIKRVRT